MPANDAASSADTVHRRHGLLSLSKLTLIGLFLGIGCGLFFGEYCAWLSILGDVFIGLLQMTVLPFIAVTLIANLGRLSLRQSRRLASIGGRILLVLWGIALLTVFLLSFCFPQWKSGSFYSTTITEPAERFEYLSFFIPSNFFSSLAENHVPAVVVFCVSLGFALSGISDRHVLIAQLDVLSRVLIRVSTSIARLAPIGVFAIAAGTTGTISFEEMGRLQAYFIVYTAGSLFLGLVALPLLVATCTPFRYRDVLNTCKDAMLTAFVTGKLIIVLPLLIEETERLFRSHQWQGEDGEDTGVTPAVDALFPVAYSFPHVGKLLSMVFVPFAAWFLGNSMTWEEYPPFLVAGLFSYFGGPIVAVPFLLDFTHLPHDMFQLFLLSGVYCERLGDAVGAIHLVTFTLLTATAFAGRLRVRVWGLVRYAVIVLSIALLVGVAMRFGLAGSLRFMQNREQIIAHMQLLEEPVEATVFQRATSNPEPLLPGETYLQRIRRRGLIRVGYNEDKLPFAYFNIRGELVGFDINMAHALARDLGVGIEFVRFERETLAKQLAGDEFDVVMSGLAGTLSRAETMQHTEPYMDLTMALVVRDYQVRRFKSFGSMSEIENLKIGFVDLSRGFAERLHSILPKAELVELGSNREFFENPMPSLEVDALLISAESGSAYTLMYPEFEVVIPNGQQFSMPLIYAVGGQDDGLSDFLEYWITLREKDGTMREFYDHWILGRTPRRQAPRWSVIRDVLHWVD